MTMLNRHSFAVGDRANAQTVAMDDAALRRAAPSIFAPTPYHRMSERYKFLPTIDVVGAFRDQGLLPVRASQSRSRIEGKGEFTRHMIRFRPAALLAEMDRVGGEYPEIVLVNSHDGTSGYNLMSGVFRLVCSNGLVVCDHDFGSVKVRHTGRNDWHERVVEATYEVLDAAPKVAGQIDTFKQIQLTGPEQLAMATAAAAIRDNDAVAPASLLNARRRDDRPAPDSTRDLWKTFNTLQENMVKGGVRYTGPTGRRNTTREIKSVDADVKTNKALWTLAAEMAKIKGA